MESANELTMMTVVDRKSIALDAASLGRLTRLQEDVVESTAKAKQDSTRDAWTLKRASQTEMLKSSFHRCVQEAAVVGLLQCNNPAVEVVSSLKQEDDASSTSSTSSFIGPESESPAPRQQQRDQQDELRASSHRASQVLEDHVQGSHREKARSWRNSLAVLERLDKQDETRRAWLEHHQLQQQFEGSTAGTVTTSRSSLSPLPSPVVPRWHKRLSGMPQHKLIVCVAHEAANQAFERAWRLENESQHELIVTKGCTCVYCSGDPSPYQTQEYQRLQKRDVTSLPCFVNLNDDDLSSVGSASLMDTSSHSTIAVSHFKSTPKIYNINSRPPRSLTPPRRTSKTAQITKRWSSTPLSTNPVSQYDLVSSAITTSRGVPSPSPPSWVSPLANRKHINYRESSKHKRESMPIPASPCGVSSVIVLEKESLDRLQLRGKHSSQTPTTPPPRKSLDEELDEEQLLRDELVALGLADA